jgi:hypothetical protein
MIDEAELANINFDKANVNVRKIFDSAAELQADMRKHSADFYYRLSLLSGGILSLDVTFIGYLASKAATLHYGELLYLSWFFLILALIGGLYRNHYNLDMGHFQATNELNRAYLERFKAQLQLVKIHPRSFEHLKTQNDINTDILNLEKNIKTVESAIKHNERKEKLNSRKWIVSQNMAHTGFVFGIILTTIFAALNLPVNIEFTFINLLQ